MMMLLMVMIMMMMMMMMMMSWSKREKKNPLFVAEYNGLSFHLSYPSLEIKIYPKQVTSDNGSFFWKTI